MAELGREGDMFQRGERRTTYGVFVRFRKSRLPMRRGIGRLEEALEIAETLRRERLHGPDDVFVVRETDGVRVDGAAPSAPPATSGAVEIDDERPALDGAPRNRAAAGPGAAQEPRHANGHRAVDAARPSPDALWHLMAGLERARRASARAAGVHARFERTATALEAAVQRGGGAPPRLVQQQARMQALRALIASAAASFDRATALAEARLQGVWTEAATAAPPRPPPRQAA